MTISDLDDAVIEQLIDSIGEATGKLVGMFAEETRAMVVRMSEAAADGSTADLTSDAHSLKGAAATYGLKGVAAIAADMEAAWRNGDKKRARELLDQIEAGLEEALERLDSRCR